MRRNPYFHVLLTLLVIQQGCKLATADDISPKDEAKTNSQSSVTSGDETPATQFNIFGRNAPGSVQSSESSPSILSNQNDYSVRNGNPFESQLLPDASLTAEPAKGINTPSAAESSLLPSNFSSPYTAKKPYKKPKVILTLSLRSKESGGPNKKKGDNSDSKSPFLFGNNVIKYDSRTNRLIIPTTTDSLEVTETSDSSEEGVNASEELGGSTVISVITEGPLLDVQNRTLTALKILEKLRALEHARLSGFQSTTTPKPLSKQAWYGNKKYETLHPRLRKNYLGKEDEHVQASTQVATTVKNNTVVEYTTLSSKVGGHFNQSPAKLQVSPSTPIPQKTRPADGPLSAFYSSTPPIVLKVGKNAVNTRFQNTSKLGNVPPETRMADSMASGSEIDSSTTANSKELIKTGETRVAITADQVGGNRPTQRPFHFGPTTQPPSTTTVISDYRQRNRVHAIGKSPHNHAYAPTEDPVSNVVVHNDDLSVEDFQDFRLANAVFGSKVGAEIPTVRPVAPRPPPISPGLGNRYNNKENEIESSEEYGDEPPLPVRLLQENVKRRPQVIIKTTPPTTTTTTRRTTTTTTPRPVFIPERRRPGIPGQGNNARAAPFQASTGVKNSQVLQNDNLPFYKEPGGIFKEHTPNHLKEFSSGLEDDEESNFIPQNTFNQRPGVKYAPKAPSAHSEPQTVYANHLAGNSNRHTNHYNQHPHQQPHHHHPNQQPQHHHPSQIHQHSSQPQYVPVTQAPIYVQHQQPIVHHPQQFAVIPSVTPQVVVSPLHQRPQQQPIYYHSQQPQLVAAVVPTQPLYQQPSPAAGFVPILHPQQAFAAAPVQPQYIPQNQYQNQPRRGNFPHRNDPNSDDYFGDPTPDDNAGKKNRNRGGSKNPEPKRKHNEYQENEDRSFQRERYPPAPAPPPAQPRRHQGDRNDRRYDDRRDAAGRGSAERNNFNGDDDRRRGDGNRGNGEGNRFNGRNGPGNSGRRQDGNIDDDFDHAAEAGLKDLKDDDFVEPNFDNPRPAYDEAPDINGRQRGQGKVRFDDDRNGREFPPDDEKPFRPSPQDFGPIRPSHQDFGGPSFDHPNLQYPQPSREQQQQPRRNSFDEGPEYDPRGFGVGHGPPPSNNVQLDPIYTRTLKQFDEEHKRKNVPQRNNDEEEPPPRRNSHRPSGQRVNEEPEEHHDDDEDRKPRPQHGRGSHDDDEERKPRPQHGRGSHDDEEEDEDQRRRPPPRRNEDEEEDDDRRRPPPRRKEEEDEEEEEEEPARNQQKPQRDEEEEEEGDEEESRDQPAKAANNDEEEEEEEEEEQEKPPRNRQRNPSKNKSNNKKKQKRPPPNEKAGDLEDDIRDINREFGGGIIFEQSKHPVILKTPSGIIVSPSPAASSVSPSSASFQINSHQQPFLLKSPSSVNNATEIIPVPKLPENLIKPSSISNITSFNIHLLETDTPVNKTKTSPKKSHSKVIVDIE